MELIQTQNTLVIQDTVISGYSNVYILQSVDYETGNVTDLNYLISADGGAFELPTDGYYKVHKFQLTTTVNSGYYITGTSLYGPGNDLFIDNSVYSILYIEDYEEEGITYSEEDYFNYYTVKNYYINLLQAKYLKNLCCCNTVTDKMIVDTLTMGLEVIKYLIEYEQYNEASRILNMLTTCTNTVITSCNCNA